MICWCVGREENVFCIYLIFTFLTLSLPFYFFISLYPYTCLFTLLYFLQIDRFVEEISSFRSFFPDYSTDFALEILETFKFDVNAAVNSVFEQTLPKHLHALTEAQRATYSSTVSRPAAVPSSAPLSTAGGQDAEFEQQLREFSLRTGRAIKGDVSASSSSSQTLNYYENEKERQQERTRLAAFAAAAAAAEELYDDDYDDALEEADFNPDFKAEQGAEHVLSNDTSRATKPASGAAEDDENDDDNDVRIVVLFLCAYFYVSTLYFHFYFCAPLHKLVYTPFRSFHLCSNLALTNLGEDALLAPNPNSREAKTCRTAIRSIKIPTSLDSRTTTAKMPPRKRIELKTRVAT